MRTATVAEAKERLEELIAAARAGETVEIRDADGVVALAPAESDSPVPNDEAVVERMEAAGVLRRGTLPPDAAAAERLPVGETGLIQALLDERERGW